MRVAQRFIPGLLAGAMLLGGIAPTFAARTQANRYGFAYGQISNLSSSGFTLTVTPKKAGAAQKVLSVTIAASVKEKALKSGSGTAPTALASGDYALVFGQKSGTSIAATKVWYSTAAFHAIHVSNPHRRLRRHAVIGTVNSAGTSATQLVVNARSGKTLTFALTRNTRFRVNKQRVTSAPSFTAGERVRVVYRRNSATSALTALRVAVLPAATQSGS